MILSIPGQATSLHTVSESDIIRPDIKLPLSEPEYSTMYTSRVKPDSHVQHFNSSHITYQTEILSTLLCVFFLFFIFTRATAWDFIWQLIKWWLCRSTCSTNESADYSLTMLTHTLCSACKTTQMDRWKAKHRNPLCHLDCRLEMWWYI